MIIFPYLVWSSLGATAGLTLHGRTGGGLISPQGYTRNFALIFSPQWKFLEAFRAEFLEISELSEPQTLTTRTLPIGLVNFLTNFLHRGSCGHVVL